jgi:hypothetical protein
VAVEVQLDGHVVEHERGGASVGRRRQAQRQPGRTEPALQLTGRPSGLHPPPVHDDDVVGELVGLLEVLRGQQQRRAVPHQPPQHVPQLEPAARVEPGRRLVEEQDLGPVDQAAARSSRRRIPPL